LSTADREDRADEEHVQYTQNLAKRGVLIVRSGPSRASVREEKRIKKMISRLEVAGERSSPPAAQRGIPGRRERVTGRRVDLRPRHGTRLDNVARLGEVAGSGWGCRTGSRSRPRFDSSCSLCETSPSSTADTPACTRQTAS
jgi:hypothetical protein